MANLYRYSFLVFILLILSGSAAAQEARYDLGFGYFGNNIWNEGAYLSFGIPRSTKTITGIKGREKLRTRSIYSQLSFYNDTRSNAGLILSAGWKWRAYSERKWSYYYTAQPISIYRSFYPRTFEVDDDGNVTELKFAGRFSWSPIVGAGLYRASQKRPGTGFELGVDVPILWPYNTYVMALLNVRLGYSFTLSTSQK